MAATMTDRDDALRLLRERREQLHALGVGQLFLYGSVARNEAGRATTLRGAGMAPVRAGRKALELVAHDTEDSYLANNERQLAIERLLIRFGGILANSFWTR
jgi:hypothetical protein